VDWTGISYAGYKYPPWAEFVGWMLCIVSILCVPGYAIYRYKKLPEGGTFKEVTTSHLLTIFKDVSLEQCSNNPMKGNPRQSWILDSTPWISDSTGTGFQSLSVEPGFWVPIVSGISDSGSGFPYIGHIIAVAKGKKNLCTSFV